ncbi:MAG: phosphatidylglycerophosphatase A [Planctomycetota bacterium]
MSPIDAAKNKHRAPIRPLNAPTLALTTLGLGFLRPAPGTWGSMPPSGLLFILLVIGVSDTIAHGVTSAVLFISCVFCVVWGRYAEERFGRKDAAEVVIDETAGVCLPLFAAPALAHVLYECGGLLPGMPWFLAAMLSCGFAFVLFRIFDIIKPPPARRLERLPHGWGVLIDDLAAGVYALLAMSACVWIV